MARFDWDVAEYEAPMDFEVIPEGTEVKMKCTEAEDKETASGGEMIKATFLIVEGEHKGRKVWMNFNTVNKSEKAQNFGRRMVAGWARACGKPNAKTTDELLERPFYAKLGIEKGTGEYKDKNIISSFLIPEGSEPGKLVQKAVEATKDVQNPDTPKEETAKPAPKSGGEGKGNRKNPWDD